MFSTVLENFPRSRASLSVPVVPSGLTSVYSDLLDLPKHWGTVTVWDWDKSHADSSDRVTGELPKLNHNLDVDIMNEEPEIISCSF